MKTLSSVAMIMAELNSLRLEMSELKSLSVKQTEMLKNMNFKVDEPDPEPTPENTYTAEPAEHKPENFDYKISTLLQELKIPASIKGYGFLREAIKAVYADGEMIRVSKILYPALAKKHNTTATSVERAIRHAIEVSYDRNYFHPLYQRGYQDKKPSNSEFIALIVDKFNLEEINN